MSIKKYSSGSWVTVPYRKYETATDTITSLPKTIIGDGQPISSYTFKGNMSQSGTPTPTTPIYPSECGERTENLVPSPLTPKSETVNGLTFNIRSDGIVKISGTAAESIIYSYKLKTPFIMPTSKTAGGNAYLYYWNTFISGGIIRLKYNNQQVDYWSIIPVNRVISKFDNAENAAIDEIEIRIPSGETINGSIGIMVTDNGEIASAYEPYGYKLPITLGSNTYPVYLSEPLRKISTYVDSVPSSGTASRVIKKLVLTGNESGWTMGTSQVGKRFGYRVLDAVESNTSKVNSVLSHLPLTVSGGTNMYPNTYTIGSDLTLLIVLDSTYTSLEQFLDWVRGQYNNGTPVTLWYRTSTPTTETFTVPTLPTSGTAETFDVDTTLKPSEVSLTYHGWHEHSDTKFT